MAILFFTFSVIVDKSVCFAFHAYRRQLPCDPQCSVVFEAATTCPPISTACLCPTFIADGPGCSACLATVDPLLASQVGEVITDCVNTASGQAPPPVGTPCALECSDVLDAATSCPSNSPACYCPTIIVDGPGCSACVALIEPSDASAIGSVITECANFVPALGSVSGLAPTSTQEALSCRSQCAIILAAASTCPPATPSCYCYYASEGIACSSCMATISPTIASIIGLLITDCSEISQPVSPSPTITGMSNAGVITVLGTTSSRSGASNVVGENFRSVYLTLATGLICIIVLFIVFS